MKGIDSMENNITKLNGKTDTHVEKETQFSKNVKEKYLSDISAIIGKHLDKDCCELERRGKGGTFKCDNYIKTPDGKAVIIENQYDDSDHDHLGKLFTYAAMLHSEERPVTDVVWILINGEGEVHAEHLNAVNVVNQICEEKGIEFKIWLLIAEREKEIYKFRQATEDDLWAYGEGKPLHLFMVKLQEAIAKDQDLKAYGNPHKAGEKCLGISRAEHGYRVNIPFRTKELKVEACFDEDNISDFKDAIYNNLSNDIEEWCEAEEIYCSELYQYNVMGEVAISSKHEDFVKIVGNIEANINSEADWDEYIGQALDLINKIVRFADYEYEKYRSQVSMG